MVRINKMLIPKAIFLFFNFRLIYPVVVDSEILLAIDIILNEKIEDTKQKLTDELDLKFLSVNNELRYLKRNIMDMLNTINTQKASNNNSNGTLNQNKKEHPGDNVAPFPGVYNNYKNIEKILMNLISCNLCCECKSNRPCIQALSNILEWIKGSNNMPKFNEKMTEYGVFLMNVYGGANKNRCKKCYMCKIIDNNPILKIYFGLSGNDYFGYQGMCNPFGLAGNNNLFGMSGTGNMFSQMMWMQKNNLNKGEESVCKRSVNQEQENKNNCGNECLRNENIKTRSKPVYGYDFNRSRNNSESKTDCITIEQRNEEISYKSNPYKCTLSSPEKKNESRELKYGNY